MLTMFILMAVITGILIIMFKVLEKHELDKQEQYLKRMKIYNKQAKKYDDINNKLREV